MKTIDQRERQKRNTERKKGVMRARGNASVKAKRFSRAFKLGFLQLICIASLMFNSNLELALSIILLKKRILRVKACCGAV